MQDPSDEMLMALADNELTGPEAQALRARIAADPALGRRFAVFTETRAMLAEAFDAGPMPDRLLTAVMAAPVEPPPPQATAPNVVAFRPARRVSAWPMALAASLVLAAGAGGFLAGRDLSPAGDPALAAAVALDNRATGEEVALTGGGTARVLGSYQTGSGLCRTLDLTLPDAGSERALVCRDGESWGVIASVSAAGAEGYVTASDSVASLIDTVLDDLGAGPALIPEEERAALAP